MRINENQLRRLVRNILDESGHPYVSPGNAETWDDIEKQIAAAARATFETNVKSNLSNKLPDLKLADQEKIVKNIMDKYDKGLIARM